MNAVEIEQAVSQLAGQDFDAENFPYAFLEAFGNKETTIKRLKSGSTNASDIKGGVLQRNNIHIATSEADAVSSILGMLRNSPATKKGKVKYILATDGVEFQAEDLTNGETVACEYKDFPNHFGFFLPLAGITTVKQVRDSSFDIRATSRLNRLYIELLKDNPEWGKAERRHDMNHFMARLIFCFFAEDTDIFNGKGLFTQTIEQMSERDSSNTHLVISEIFRAMNTKTEDRELAKLPRWANGFPYVNGGLFSGSTDTPKFSKIARSYLVHIGNLDWQKINPDIFGSMIQAVTDDDERGELGMHYTSVPNILKVLNPLFLDDLREKLEDAGDNPRTLLNLRKRISKIRVFDPACGSGNFLVIAYKQLREIENEINTRRGDKGRRSEIPITNFRGIELRDFAAEIARLALIIAEYQCDVVYLGQKEALAEFLPLNSSNWIIQGNALRLDWLSICPPTGTGVQLKADDLFETPLDQSEIDFENEGGETYICGNPPFSGTRKQTTEQKSDLEKILSKYTNKWKNADYVGGWLIKAAEYSSKAPCRFAFVATNSLCQGQQVPITWKILNSLGFFIRFAHLSFIWSNLAQNKAGVTVIIVGLDSYSSGKRYLYSDESVKDVDHINPYLTDHKIKIIEASKTPLFLTKKMDYGVYYSKSQGLILNSDEAKNLREQGFPEHMLKRFLGSNEFIKGLERYCLWISEEELKGALAFSEVSERINSVRQERLSTKDKAVNKLAGKPYQFRERKGELNKILVPIVSSENREYLPVGMAGKSVIPTNKTFYVEEPSLWQFSILSSKLHLSWIAAICGRLEMRYSYSNTLGWNTFPIPILTEKNKSDLSVTAAEILLAREKSFPASIYDMYEPEKMPENLRLAHERNDEVLERIYIGRRFKNDTERLEKLFDFYTKMTEKKGA
ncbi:class I SAM-dependent DNA methyltransferase [Thiomicrospira sp.]|uniref:class I SAM-dependent DNA methyltransferase n=1 Tax=Thiomicrospira sp. TaxID=935 RepID=UPI002F935B15